MLYDTYYQKIIMSLSSPKIIPKHRTAERNKVIIYTYIFFLFFLICHIHKIHF